MNDSLKLWGLIFSVYIQGKIWQKEQYSTWSLLDMTIVERISARFVDSSPPWSLSLLAWCTIDVSLFLKESFHVVLFHIRVISDDNHHLKLCVTFALNFMFFSALQCQDTFFYPREATCAPSDLYTREGIIYFRKECWELVP